MIIPQRVFGPTLVLALALSGAGCGGVFGGSATRTPTSTFTPAPTLTPTLTPTPTASPTPTSTPTPTATPTPALPPNPDALRRWDSIPVRYCVVSDTIGYVGDDVLIEAVERAFATWGVPTTNTGGCDALKDNDGSNEIAWGDLSPGLHRGSGTYEAGLTSVRYSECTAGCDPDDPVHLVEADITIDTAPPPGFRNAHCLYSTLLHEAGHFLGLEHLPPPAVMAAETSTCPDMLTDADLDALRARYGAVAHPSP